MKMDAAPANVPSIAERLLGELTLTVILPGLLLGVMVTGFIWVLAKSSGQSGFDVSEFLRDDAAKLSSARLFAFVALCIHTWVIAIETMTQRMTSDMMMVYALTWSGSLVLKSAVDKWNGTLPLAAKGPTS